MKFNRGEVNMLNTINSSVMGYKQMSVPYTVLKIEEDSKNVAIFLPGKGYTVKSPAFHYATELFLNKSFDVLQVNYQ